MSRRGCGERANSRRGAGGASGVELLLALPVVLLLGLGIVQFAMVYQAKHALDHALNQAARRGALEHAATEAILQGLGAGLVPYLEGASDASSLVAAEARAVAHLAEGLDAGWIRLRQRSPTIQSFDDWGVPARDAFGERIPGLIEIPNDNLDNRRHTMQPVAGSAGEQAGEPIGLRSGQTLADANLLRLDLTYGVRLSVPIVGPWILAMLQRWGSCASVDGSGPGTVGGSPAGAPSAALGLLRFGAVSARSAEPSDHCAIYAARDGDGRPVGRIPLRLSATVRMMSPPRLSSLTGSRVDTAALPSDRPAAGSPDPIAPGGPGGMGEGAAAGPRGEGAGDVDRDRITAGNGGDRGSSDGPLRSGGASQRPASALLAFSNGFLSIGSDRPYPTPTAVAGRHPALCPD